MGRISGEFDEKDIAFAFWFCEREPTCEVCPLREKENEGLKCRKYLREEVERLLSSCIGWAHLKKNKEKEEQIRKLKDCYHYCIMSSTKDRCLNCEWRGTNTCYFLVTNITNTLMDYAEE